MKSVKATAAGTGARGPLLTAFILRLALPFFVVRVFGANDEAAWARFFAPDTYSYLIPAQNLLEHGAFFANASTPEIFRTPGYPLVLAIGLIARSPIVITLLLQALAGTLTVWCTMRTASLLFRDADADDAAGADGDDAIRAARAVKAVTACGWLAACDPLALLYGSLLIADTLLATAISIVVLLLVTHFRQPSTRSAVALGVAIAAAAYVKPIAYYLPVVIIPWLWFERRRSAASRRVHIGAVEAWPQLTRDLVAMAATVAILCGAWQVRNGMVAGFWGFSTLTARAVYVTAGGGVTAAREGRPFGDVRRERLEDAAIRTSREPLHVGDMYRRGLSDIIGSPITALTVHVKGMLLTLFDPATLDYLRLFGAYPARSPVTRYDGQGLAATIATIAREYPAVVWWSLLLEAILIGYLGPAARGAWRALRAGIPEARALVLLIAYFLVLSGGIFGAARFRLPIAPLLILLGGYAFRGYALATRRGVRKPIPVGYTEPA